jgi:hypothetical protein
MTTNVEFFVRPDGNVLRIIEIQQDATSVKITLENGLSRWFKNNEIVINPPYIKLIK